MSLLSDLGARRIINARGTVTRLSGGIMHPEVIAAMTDASRQCFDMSELQAAASAEIARITGAEAGYIASGASACLMLGAAAAMTGLDAASMARLPQDGPRREIIIVRSQRNAYDHALRTAGANLVEVGLPDRHAGAGVRDAQGWQIESAITERTAAIFHVAAENAEPSLPEVVAIARRHGLPVLVDAAAQLPPQANLRRFIEVGADLVAFSGGKVLGGPQASGFLCGRRDLIMAAALQHLDLDQYIDTWTPPDTLIDRRRLVGMPVTGIGRPCKAGKEEIAGLLAALQLFVREGDGVRHARWLATLAAVREANTDWRAGMSIQHEADNDRVPHISIDTGSPEVARELTRRLLSHSPAIHVDDSERHHGRIILSPLALDVEDAAIVGRALDAAKPGP